MHLQISALQSDQSRQIKLRLIKMKKGKGHGWKDDIA